MKKAISTCIKEKMPPETKGLVFNGERDAYWLAPFMGLTPNKTEAFVYTFNYVKTHFKTLPISMTNMKFEVIK